MGLWRWAIRGPYGLDSRHCMGPFHGSSRDSHRKLLAGQTSHCLDIGKQRTLLTQTPLQWPFSRRRVESKLVSNGTLARRIIRWWQDIHMEANTRGWMDMSKCFGWKDTISVAEWFSKFVNPIMSFFFFALCSLLFLFYSLPLSMYVCPLLWRAINLQQGSWINTINYILFR